MLPFASFTDIILDPIVNAGTDFIGSTGLPAVFILMMLESACLPIPRLSWSSALRRTQ